MGRAQSQKSDLRPGCDLEITKQFGKSYEAKKEPYSLTRGYTGRNYPIDNTPAWGRLRNDAGGVLRKKLVAEYSIENRDPNSYHGSNSPQVQQGACTKN